MASSQDENVNENQRTRPPCMVKIFSSMMAAIGRQLKQSVNVFHNLMLYRRLPESLAAAMVRV
jgi:hypothetical protein